jgi:hypothetical protein
LQMDTDKTDEVCPVAMHQSVRHILPEAR